MFSKNQYFTVDGDYDFKVICAFKVKAQEPKHTYFSDWYVQELVARRSEFCKLGAKLAESGELGFSRTMFRKANKISLQIDEIMSWNQAAQSAVEDWAAWIIETRM